MGIDFDEVRVLTRRGDRPEVEELTGRCSCTVIR
jgi:hypothetical protein